MMHDDVEEMVVVVMVNDANAFKRCIKVDNKMNNCQAKPVQTPGRIVTQRETTHKHEWMNERKELTQLSSHLKLN